MSREINPKRVKLVRELRMLDEADWPDTMGREQLYEFCLVTRFPPAFFRQDDPPELELFHCHESRYRTCGAERGVPERGKS